MRILVPSQVVLLTSVVIGSVLPAQSQTSTPSVLWATVVGGPGWDYVYGPALGPHGDLYTAGAFEVTAFTNQVNSPKNVMLRFNSSGAVIASQAYNGAAPFAIAVDSQGNYYLTGVIAEPNILGTGHANDFFLAKYSPDGVLIWIRTGGTLDATREHRSEGRAVALDSTGNVYAAGKSEGSAVFGDVSFSDGGGPLLCKYDSVGNLLWVKRADSLPDDLGYYGSASALAIDSGGNAIVTGFLKNGPADFGGTNVFVAGPSDGEFFVAKYKPNGDVHWAQVAYGGGGVAADKQGNIYFSGYVAGELPTTMDCGKFSPDGQVLWEKTFSAASGAAVALDPHDQPIFTGRLYGTANLGSVTVQGQGTTWSDILLFKTDSAGNTQWAMSAGGPLDEWGSFLACDARGNIYLAGQLRETSGFMLGSVQIKPLYPGGEVDQDNFVIRITECPPLSLMRTAQSIVLSWPVFASDYSLEATDSLRNATWLPVSAATTTNGNQLSVQLPVEGSAKFFRLKKP